ncbi:MAG: nitrate ABC transporter substrate-binding protein, partial [Gammaproteobacteria bacterium]
TEGTHRADWELVQATAPITMGPDRFFDGKVFDPARLMEYLTSFKVQHAQVSPQALARLNP